MTNICSERFAESKDFYTKLFDFSVDYDSDWFVHLISEDRNLELGLIDPVSELVPEAFRGHPQGFYLTLVVDDVEEVFALAKEEGFEIVAEPEDTFYGQRRLLLKDPNGVLIDVSAPV